MTLDKNKDYYGLPVHPVCDLFPLLDPVDLDDLQFDIDKHGLITPLTLYEGQLVDGRNRAIACQKAGVQPIFREWRDVYKGKQSITEWIWSTNVERRHLTTDQRVALGVQFDGLKKKEAAKEKQVEAGKANAPKGAEARWSKGAKGSDDALQMNSSEGHFSPKVEVVPAEPPQGPKPAEPPPKPKPAPQVRAQIAEELKTSEYKVQQALNAQKADPSLLKQVSNGTMKLREAATAAKAKVAQPNAPSRRPARRSSQTLTKPTKKAIMNALSTAHGISRGLADVDVADVAQANSQWTDQELKDFSRMVLRTVKILRGVGIQLRDVLAARS